VKTAQELTRAVREAKPGTNILLAPGTYTGGLHFSGPKGREGKPVVIAAADPKNVPVIKGGTTCMHLSDPAYVELNGLTFTGARVNGLNIDDGGSPDTPAHHIVLRNLKIHDIGTRGNMDGIKLSGLDRFRVEGCTLERWGGGGSGIDMVGCHDGIIEGCTFRHGDMTGSNGVQTKGGSKDIVVRRCRFEHAGQRAVNIGGSTGLQYFRPKVGGYEAKDITVEGCTFVGSLAPVAFVGVDGATFRFNTIYCPAKWVLRILQETTDARFVPSRNGVFTDNIIVFRSRQVRTHANIGPTTAPNTFRFARNWWYSLDAPSRSTPRLPSRERDGTYGKDPLLRDPAGGDLRLRPDSPAAKFGAEALPDE